MDTLLSDTLSSSYRKVVLVTRGTPKCRIVSVSFCVPENKQHFKSPCHRFLGSGAGGRDARVQEGTQYKPDLASGSGVPPTGLQRARGTRASCSGPDSTCCVHSHYPST